MAKAPEAPKGPTIEQRVAELEDEVKSIRRKLNATAKSGEEMRSVLGPRLQSRGITP